jgi:hypothetical protein
MDQLAYVETGVCRENLGGIDIALQCAPTSTGAVYLGFYTDLSLHACPRLTYMSEGEMLILLASNTRMQASSWANRWAVSGRRARIDASMSRGPLSSAPHASGKVRLGFTYRITTLSILHSAAVGPAHSLSGPIEPHCSPARPLTSSAAVCAPLPHASAALVCSSTSNLFDSPLHQLTAPEYRPPGHQYEPAPKPSIIKTPPPPRPPRPRPRSLPSPRSHTTFTREPPGCQYMVHTCRVC